MERKENERKELKGKKILREIFKNDLPKEILERNKMSFDVGSGIRKLVVESLADFKKTERMLLKTIIEKHPSGILCKKGHLLNLFKFLFSKEASPS